MYLKSRITQLCLEGIDIVSPPQRGKLHMTNSTLCFNLCNRVPACIRICHQIRSEMRARFLSGVCKNGLG